MCCVGDRDRDLGERERWVRREDLVDRRVEGTIVICGGSAMVGDVDLDLDLDLDLAEPVM